MKEADKRKIAVKRMPNEDTTKYIDYSQPLNFKELMKSSNSTFKTKSAEKLERARLLGKEISKAQKKVKVKVSDDEIAEMIHEHRKKKNPKW